MQKLFASVCRLELAVKQVDIRFIVRLKSTGFRGGLHTRKKPLKTLEDEITNLKLKIIEWGGGSVFCKFTQSL